MLTACFDHRTIHHIDHATNPTAWQIDVSEWQKAAVDLTMQIREFLTDFRNFQTILDDLRDNKFPQFCIGKTTWGEIVKLMGFSATEAEAETETLLIRLASLPTTHVELSMDGDLLLHTILPILPDAKLQFALYYIDIAPVPSNKQSWREFELKTWLALNEDASYSMNFASLERLNEGCISGEEIWWCFETFPVQKLDAESCFRKAISIDKLPEISCFGPKVKTPTVHITDVTENRYLVSAGRQTTLKQSCTKDDGTADAPTIIQLVAGCTLYELPAKCYAEILDQVLPTNWYIPVSEEALVIVTSLADLPDEDLTETGDQSQVQQPGMQQQIAPAEIATSTEEIVTETVTEPVTEPATEPSTATKVDAKGSKGDTGTAVSPKGTSGEKGETPIVSSQTIKGTKGDKGASSAKGIPPSTRSGTGTSKGASTSTSVGSGGRSKGLKTGTFAAINKLQQEHLEQQKKKATEKLVEAEMMQAEARTDTNDPSTSEEDKQIRELATQVLATIANWFRENIDTGDIVSMVFSVLALIISLGLIVYNWRSARRRTPKAARKSAEGRFRKWLSRNSKSRKRRSQEMPTTQPRRRARAPAAPTGTQIVTPATFHTHADPLPYIPTRRSTSQPSNRSSPIYASLPTAPPITTTPMQEGGIRVTVRTSEI
jgi:hypothetical protein